MTSTIRRNRFSPKLVRVMILVHILGFCGAGYIWFIDNSFGLIMTAVAYFFMCAISITNGAHRYFTHEAFKLKRWLAYTLAVIFSGTLQNSLYWWVGKHAEHHQFEDQKGLDPHTPKDGFWHSHMLWMLKRDAQTIPKHIRDRFKAPSTRNDVMNWHREHHRVCEVIMILLVPALLGMMFGGAAAVTIAEVTIPSLAVNALGGVLVIGFTRLLFQYHFTWIVNSIGHSFGDRLDATARNFLGIFSPIFGVLTVGEAHHANHHIAARHWKLGRRFWQLDPGAWVARVWKTLGWAYDFKEPANRNRTRSFA